MVESDAFGKHGLGGADRGNGDLNSDERVGAGRAGEACSGWALGRFVLYMAIIAVCVAAIVYLLFNANPMDEPQIKHAGPQSLLQAPARPAVPSALLTRADLEKPVPAEAATFVMPA